MPSPRAAGPRPEDEHNEDAPSRRRRAGTGRRGVGVVEPPDESNDTRPLPGQHHFEWVPDEPLESAIAQARAFYGQRGQAIQSVWTPAKRHRERRHMLANGRSDECTRTRACRSGISSLN